MDDKYPRYFFIVGVIYLVFLLLALIVIPAEFYSLDNILFVLMMGLPIPVFVMYFLEKPEIKQIMYLRYLFPIVSIIAIIISFLLIWIFF
ncbi:MAG: hypothetical protein V1870_02520 [Candidatus Aenigmatarchaeota archaeon]